MLTITFKSALTYTQILHAIYMMCRADMASIQDCEAVLACTKVINDHEAIIDLSNADEWTIQFAEDAALGLKDGHILNLTQHVATPEQVDAGVVEPRDKEEIRKLLTFDDGLPTREVIRERAKRLVTYAQMYGFSMVMVGSAQWLAGPLEEELRRYDIQPLYAYSKRISQEEVLADGTIKKTAIFKHLGFVFA